MWLAALGNVFFLFFDFDAAIFLISTEVTEQGFEKYQVIVSDKSNLLRKADFLLKSGFQVLRNTPANILYS